MSITINRNDYSDILDYHSKAEAELNFQTNGKEEDENFNYKLTNKSNIFADLGAWHGMYLPSEINNSFFGPLILDQEIPVNAGQYCSNYTFTDGSRNCVLLNHRTYSVPGKLIIEQIYEEFTMVKELIYISHRTSCVKTKITNKLKTDLNLNVKVNGIAYQQIKYSSASNPKDWKDFLLGIVHTTHGFQCQYKSLVNSKVDEQFSIRFANTISDFKIVHEGNEHHYSFELEPTLIKSKGVHEFYEVQHFDFTHNMPVVQHTSLKQQWTLNEQRWNKYVTNLSSHASDRYLPLSIKCLQTLISNWRSPAGVLKHNFFVPSIAYTDFIGAWSWDTWKICVGVSLFDLELAADCVKNMFDYQITAKDELRPQDVGMIPDCVFYNQHPDRNGTGGNWNERNTKPSIAAWSILFLYEQGLDLNFLKTIYPKIKAYNQWWNHNRSYNHDNILQFGATVDKLNDWNNPKTIIEAAAWESGMDNAPRFDWANTKALQVFNQKQELIGYVIDQSSIDLNAFNYLELVSLAKIAKLLNLDDEAKVFTASAENVKTWINSHSYDKKQKCYFDVKLGSNKLVNKQGKGDECLVCLFAGAADIDKAEEVIKSLSKKNYLTHVCFPSVAADSEKFEPTNYWRGPVWLDQWYFGLKGLSNYKQQKMAKNLLDKSLQNMDKLLTPGYCIKENYNPLDGTGLAAANFSWSASMLLVALKEIDID